MSVSAKHPDIHEDSTGVTWIVNKKAGSFRVVDAITYGVSLRQLDRDVYTDILQKNNYNLDVLLQLLRRQTGQR
jgi:ABC-type transporter MlaC component